MQFLFGKFYYKFLCKTIDNNFTWDYTNGNSRERIMRSFVSTQNSKLYGEMAIVLADRHAFCVDDEFSNIS